ncbi:MAG: hypothetical protein RLZZ592_2577 [Pseudomonadota bacterium]|jgi:two-component system phosphate regulon response regulator PhoB|nr:two-component system, OmpR family, phosphate regulon response regulator PhoB [Pseudomonadota bacterium]
MSDAASPATAPVRRTVLTLVAEPVIRELLVLHLREAGFIPVAAASAVEARRLAADVLPDVLLIDPDSPETADLGFCEQLPAQVRIVVTSGSGTCCGALPRVALCLHKPYAPRELVERLRSLPDLRAEPLPLPAPARPGGIEIDMDRHLITVRRQGRRVELDLSPIELRLLRCLIEQSGRVLTRETLRSRVWGEAADVDLRTVDQNIRRLRRELGEAAAGEMIRTVRGIGYRFSAEAAG